jgi:hypothetical protein
MRGVDDAAWAPLGDRACIVIQGLVAIASSNEAFNLAPVSGTGSDSKTNEVEKSYKKKSGAL